MGSRKSTQSIHCKSEIALVNITPPLRSIWLKVIQQITISTTEYNNYYKVIYFLNLFLACFSGMLEVANGRKLAR